MLIYVEDFALGVSLRAAGCVVVNYWHSGSKSETSNSGGRRAPAMDQVIEYVYSSEIVLSL